ncbi:hypothetical protein, partial [Hymenobacter tenuis]
CFILCIYAIVMDFELEAAFINRYVTKNKRQRYLDFIGVPKKRKVFLEMLCHGQHLDKSILKRIVGNNKMAILAHIARMPNNTRCYIISVDPALDGRDFTVSSALDELHPYIEGSILIFGCCEAVYYVGEPPKNEWLNR